MRRTKVFLLLFFQKKKCFPPCLIDLRETRAALPLSEAQAADIHAQAWPIMEAMIERVRTPARDRSAEPAHTFKPEGA